MQSFATRVLCGLAVILLVPMLAMAQQRGAITGTVTGADNDGPLPGASVQIIESQVGTATNVDGEYTIEGIEPGEKTLRVSFVGYESVTRTVNVNAGETTTADFTLNPSTKDLGEVVVTGVSSETPQAKLSFNVDQVSSEQLEEAPASSPIGSLQGKVAGASIIPGSGAPGDGFDVQLRGATSISGDNEPLFIVDGVILGKGASQVDISSLDVKNVEIVKGAAASSLYGSRAQNGVVNITTKRGSGAALGETRVTVRSEFGIQSLEETPSVIDAHNLKTNENGVLLDAEGNEIEYNRSVEPAINGPNGTRFFNKSFEDLRKPDGSSYDINSPFEQFFEPGNTTTNYIAVSQNNEQTNFRLSFTDTREEGPIQGPVSTNGYDRQSFRLNVDHRPSESWNISASGYYAQSTSDDPTSSASISPLFDLWFQYPLADLTRRDEETGELNHRADPNAIEDNPLYAIENSTLEFTRERFLGNFNIEYSPFEWLDVSGSLSYDRSNRNDAEFFKKGFQTIDPNPINEGETQKIFITEEALNGDVTASFTREFGEITARSQLKYQIERQNYEHNFVEGQDLTAAGIADLDNVAGSKSIFSGTNNRAGIEKIRSEGYYWTASGDYGDRYILDLLVRRDGSSLFGADERWQTYYRAAGAYRISEEPFWPGGDVVDEFKLRYSYGTAGGRPPYEAQYQTYELNEGAAEKNTKGNSELKPEFQIEQEYGVEVGFFDRFFANFTYATTTVEDQILRVPLPAVQGFSAQWRNAGTIESDTYELSLDVDLLRTQSMNWSAGVIFDRTRQEITEFNSNPFRTGPNQHQAFFFREGEVMGAMYGTKHVTEKEELEEMGFNLNNFAENDDGYLVPVGAGASWKDGFEKNLWGTTVQTANGPLNWGLPIQFVDSTGSDFHKIGDTNPDYNVSFNTTFNYKGFSLYTLLSAQVGGDVYNATRQWGYRDDRAEQVGQIGKPKEKQKPRSYYQTLYNVNSKNNEFVEDATFLKVREVSLGYTFDESQLNELLGPSNILNKIGLRIVGRNLLTFTDYQGIDPEVGGSTSSGSVTDNSSIFRIDNFEYPRFRTITGRIEVQF